MTPRNLLRRILGGERVDSRAIPAAEPPKSLFQQVIDAPALFNRRTRRSVGLFGRFWKWDLNASEETRRTYVPRYIRRHFTGDLMTAARTRRQRRHRARIMRITRSKGLI